MKAQPNTPEGLPAQLPPTPEVKSQKLSQLIERAEDALRLRGHRPAVGDILYTNAFRGPSAQTAVIMCAVCPLDAYVITDPLPYEAEISGSAVAQYCPERQEEKPRLTYRERRLRKAERLRGWAEKREQKATAAYETAHKLGSMIPMGQPILVGYHSERMHRRHIEKMDNGMRACLENSKKAEQMNSKADEIERQADRAIYNDDPDAMHQLAEKIANLEAGRERIKAYNATCRKGHPDRSILSPVELKSLESVLKFSPFQSKGEAMPGYVTTNMGAQIRKAKERLAFLMRKEADDHSPFGRGQSARKAGLSRESNPYGDSAAGDEYIRGFESVDRAPEQEGQ